ncbi:hypothetical protein RF11_00010 [Thelohanellus kitauei]|uniref:Uncharacterized protein n=1 Tax=Thelohanellus kitauei TaxID=669202 RepID=A0A0C2N2Y9_THEKT|nr:hypothetical protein RF11_00010 [Thelohanellus kitauei]
MYIFRYRFDSEYYSIDDIVPRIIDKKLPLADVQEKGGSQEDLPKEHIISINEKYFSAWNTPSDKECTVLQVEAGFDYLSKYKIMEMCLENDYGNVLLNYQDCICAASCFDRHSHKQVYSPSNSGRNYTNKALRNP